MKQETAEIKPRAVLAWSDLKIRSEMTDTDEDCSKVTRMSPP
uniref:Uncharacterized protein n=1 Tax=Anguilla anguilla TaxID=7936 RepID=A0A0E9RK01_ANGAN